ncbi:MAG TPA: GAF domain-containing sensor histidine kinase [Acidimicrobiales bacterium]|nr:GAF domain-containing sensor histidine kinase [Acidimicrobiales bacterium]
MALTFAEGADRLAADRLIIAVRALASARRMDDIVEVVRHAARELVDADGATFVLRDEGCCFYVDEDAIAPLWRGQRFPLEACISGWSMLHAQQVVIPDIYLDDRIPHDAYRPTFVRSLVMTPVRAEESVAAIGTYWADNHVATESELDVLQALADSTAVAIESVRVLTSLEQRVQERTAELAAANRDLKAFAHLAAHDLRNPLLTAGAYVELALRTDGDNLTEEGIEALEEAQAAHQRMTELVSAILEYSTVAQADMHRERVDLDTVVARACADLDALIKQRHAVVTVRSPLPSTFGNEPLLERAVQNVIANAINYGDPVAPHVIVEGACHDDGWVTLAISDNGAGVSAAERDTIFAMFTRGKSGRDGADGFGLGLALVDRVMEKHRGAVTVGEGPEGGAQFTLSLPPPPA